MRILTLILGIAILHGLDPTAIAATAEGEFTRVDNGVCRVWDEEPDSRESRVITWSGPCPQGNAEGFGELRTVWDDGTSTEVFIGHMEGGRPNGIGRLTIDTPTVVYVGEWMNGRFHGAGSHRVDDVLVKGQFKDGEADGPGLILFAEGSPRHGDSAMAALSGGLPVGEAIYRHSDGRIFVGTLGSDWSPDIGRYVNADR